MALFCAGSYKRVSRQSVIQMDGVPLRKSQAGNSMVSIVRLFDTVAIQLIPKGLMTGLRSVHTGNTVEFTIVQIQIVN